MSVSITSKSAIIHNVVGGTKRFVPQLYNDFLAVPAVDNQYFETDKYYFCLSHMFGLKEVRFWKTSKRVSVVSTKFTKRF